MDLINQAEEIMINIQKQQSDMIKNIEIAIKTAGDDQIDRLEAALIAFDAVSSIMAENAHAMEVNDKGTQLLSRLKELRSLKNLLLQLNQREIAKMKSMNAPISDIVDVVKGMLLLLGSPKKDCTDWKTMRGVLGRTGKESLKRKITAFDIHDVSDKAHERVMVLMSGVELDRVTKVSSTGSIFYAFVRGALTMLSYGNEDEIKEKEANAKKIRQQEKKQEEERIQKEIYDKEKADKQVAEMLNHASLRRNKKKRISTF